MAQLNVTELDFFGIRDNLKEYLKSQSEFSDYNFDGAGLSVLIDLLAYNTHYNATLAHLLSNEMFIDSAVKRGSVVSIAKSLGYTPRSIRSARIDATVTVTPAPSYTENSLTLNKNVAFTGTGIDGNTYVFYPEEAVTALKSGNSFTFSVRLIKGKKATDTFTVASDTVSGPFTLLNGSVDTSTLECIVQKSATELEYTTFTQSQNILGITSNCDVLTFLSRSSFPRTRRITPLSERLLFVESAYRFFVFRAGLSTVETY